MSSQSTGFFDSSPLLASLALGRSDLSLLRLDLDDLEERSLLRDRLFRFRSRDRFRLLSFDDDLRDFRSLSRDLGEEIWKNNFANVELKSLSVPLMGEVLLP